MAYENIRLRKRNFTVVDGYFYMIDENQDALIVKTDDGTQAYSYPLGTVLSNEVRSLEYDGRYFWTLERPGSNTIIIRQWLINNYALEQQDVITLQPGSGPGAGINWDSLAFTVEHYQCQTSADLNPTDVIIGVTGLGFNLNDTDRMDSASLVTIGPNASGEYEELDPVTINTGSFTINAPGLQNFYAQGTRIVFSNRLWVFNDYSGTTSQGAIYEIPFPLGTTVGVTPAAEAGAFADVNSCTFFDMSDTFGGATNSKNSICYVKATNMIFLDPRDFDTSFGSMVMDNLEDDQLNTIPIYDLAMEGVNVYRLQEKATYYGTTYPWSSYNYQLSTLEQFITSISLSADPAILPADTVSTSTITAIVRDQFNNPISSKPVTFTEDDSVGYISPPTTVNTDSDGIAQVTYNAGNTAREVKITATASQ